MKRSHRKNNDIVIVGLGLMGASLACDLQKTVIKKRIVVLSRNKNKVNQAVKKGVAGWGTTKPEEAFAHAGMIIIATPVRTIERFIMLADKYAPRGTIVTDIGSTKKEIVLWAGKKKFKNISFIGSHPLAGSDKSGMQNAIKGLYKGEVCFVTPGRGAIESKVKKVVSLWRKVGARVLVIGASLHDTLLAASSHYPHVLAFALMNATHKHSKAALDFVGTGFKDTTRISASATDIWYDIIVSNKANILKKNVEMIDELKRVQKIIARGKEKEIKRYLAKAKALRDSL